MSEKPKIITDPNKEEREDLDIASRNHALQLVIKALTIPQGGSWIGALGVYHGEKCQAILQENIERVRRVLFPKRVLKKIWPEHYPRKKRSS